MSTMVRSRTGPEVAPASSPGTGVGNPDSGAASFAPASVSFMTGERTPIASASQARSARMAEARHNPYSRAPMTAPAIEVAHLTKRFADVTAVDDVSFAVAKGATVGLLGGNGAGKTTTLSMLLGLLVPSGGRVTVLGEDMLRRRAAVLPRMNFSSPYVDLPHRLTVRQNLRVYGLLYGVKQIGRQIERLSADLGLGELLDRPTGTLSAGQRTRVQLAKALINEPSLLLFDEPTASLDPDTGDWVRGYIESYRARVGATLLIASHNMAEVERLCGQVLMMRTGRIVDQGAPEQLIQRYGRQTLEEVFLDIARRPDRVEAAQ
jgi:ABC-2 type transport system ATP-binding protein